MKKTSANQVTAYAIAEMADRGQDISRHFSNSFSVVRPSNRRVNVDFSAPMLEELDREASALNVSRQAVIKTMLRDALDRRHLAVQARHVGKPKRGHS
ncbi:ribbon-helix-helix protein, CopG family [Terriglobus sp.]|uniref:ribbon-helix-helix protein, CopG family n=1 Tax=Terriglobus sp. TaxID=1889013 RepID=UPI003B00C6F8